MKQLVYISLLITTFYTFPTSKIRRSPYKESVMYDYVALIPYALIAERLRIQESDHKVAVMPLLMQDKRIITDAVSVLFGLRNFKISRTYYGATEHCRAHITTSQEISGNPLLLTLKKFEETYIKFKKIDQKDQNDFFDEYARKAAAQKLKK